MTDAARLVRNYGLTQEVAEAVADDEPVAALAAAILSSYHVVAAQPGTLSLYAIEGDRDHPPAIVAYPVHAWLVSVAPGDTPWATGWPLDASGEETISFEQADNLIAVLAPGERIEPWHVKAAAEYLEKRR